MIAKCPYPQEMQDALDKCDSEAEQIIEAFRITLQSPPPIIYHYTNDVGLRGILETGRLWLTDIFNLNDPSEVNYGFRHAINVLGGLVADGPPESKAFARQITGFAEQKGIQGSAHFFVCSFSSCGDDLGQWRAYADNGRGYALGFDGMALENAFTTGGTRTPDPEPYAAAFPMSYKEAEIASTHRQIIERMLGLISLARGRHLDASTINSYMGDLSVRLMVRMIHAALFFKHAAYENEKEYRFLHMYSAAAPPLEMKLIFRPYSLIRYEEFDWRSVAPSALRQIVVGPAADCKKTSQFARDCLHLFHQETVPITCSAIPYRAV